MVEENEQELQDNVGEKEGSETTETKEVTEKSPELPEDSKDETEAAQPEKKDVVDTKDEVHEKIAEVNTETEQLTEKSPEIPVENKEEAETAQPETKEIVDTKDEVLEEIAEKTTETEQLTDKSHEIPVGNKEEAEAAQSETKEVVDIQDHGIEKIDEENAEDAEDTDNHHRHVIPILDYHAMSMENLVGEFQRLVRNEKVQAIKKHVDGIKHEFDLKFQEFIEHKKEDFVNNGGNEIDFRYNSVTKKQFNEVYQDYREKRNQYYKNIEKSHKQSLADRLEIIEELKGLVNVEEDMNTTYKSFKAIQERWRHAGPVPRTHYNDVWKTYHHHIEIFYDFLHLNRELRDLDFKHNLEGKTKIVEQAEALAVEPDLNRAFRELQTLHKIWKEDIGPVGKAHRDEIWDRFSNATKVLHQRRQDHYKDLEKVYEQNLEKKHQIIASISAVAETVADNHKALQQQIKQIEALRNDFFKAGKVPQKVNEKTWASFKDAVRAFNRNKNAYYKNLKKDQQENLDKKRELLQLAVSLKDSDDWDSATQEMKRIQSEWKKIGHVPRKFSDSIWKEFKGACNHYFDRLHALKNEANKEEDDNYLKKTNCLDSLKSFELSDDREKDIKAIKGFLDEWKKLGRVPFNKKNINQKFNKIIDALFRKLNVSRQESELLKYGNKIQQLAKKDDDYAINKERTFIRRKIDESKSEIRQLETNLQFFSNASEDNPLVKDVVKRVENHKASLITWQEKLKKLNILENNLNKPVEEAIESQEGGSEEE